MYLSSTVMQVLASVIVVAAVFLAPVAAGPQRGEDVTREQRDFVKPRRGENVTSEQRDFDKLPKVAFHMMMMRKCFRCVNRTKHV